MPDSAEFTSFTSYSQHGEEAVLLSLLRTSWPKCLVEVGAHDGVSLSNSRLLIERFGYAAVLIEPMPGPFASLSAVYADHPNVTCLNLAIADQPGVGTMYVGSDGPNGTMSTLCRDENAWFEAHRTDETVSVPIETLTAVLDRQGAPTDITLLLVDAEGMDFEVLHSLDFTKYSPRVIITEDYVHDPIKHIQKIQYLLEKNYSLIQSVGANTIWLRQDLLVEPQEIRLSDQVRGVTVSQSTGRAVRENSIFIFDPALEDTLGHHYHFDLTLAAAGWRLGYRPVVLGAEASDWRGFPDHVAVDPLFRFHHGRGARIEGPVWSQPFESEAVLFELQMAGFSRHTLRAGDILFFHSLLAPQLLGLARWLGGQTLPRAVTLVIFPIFPDFHEPARADAYRQAFARLTASGVRLVVCAETAPLQETLSNLLPAGQTAQLAPFLFPIVEYPLPSPSSEDRPVRVAFLGDAGRTSKGAALLPEILRSVIPQVGGGVEVFVSLTQPNPALDDVPGVTVSTTPLGTDAYCKRLLWADILLMPYDPAHYRTAGSGIAFEGALAGKAMVIPGETALAESLVSLGANAYPFAPWTAEAVASALANACQSARAKHAAALDVARHLRETRGAEGWLRRLLTKAPIEAGSPAAALPPQPSLQDDRVQALEAALAHAVQAQQAILRSTSWRLTAPLRALLNRIRG